MRVMMVTGMLSSLGNVLPFEEMLPPPLISDYPMTTTTAPRVRRSAEMMTNGLTSRMTAN